MSELSRPKLWSDFDGTAVGLVAKTNWRNWTKYPLPALDGYLDFLSGIQQGGVEVAGIVSRRPNILPRRLATASSIARLGLDVYFPDRRQVVLAGSEEKKAQFVADRAKEAVVGMIDDKPHKFGAALLKAMFASSSPGVADVKQEVVLGVVSHNNGAEYMERLAKGAAATPGVDLYEGSGGMLMQGIGFAIHVVALEPYGLQAGRSFAARLTELSGRQW